MSGGHKARLGKIRVWATSPGPRSLA